MIICKVMAVVGATGARGGGLVRAIQADPRGEFVARAITRDINSEKARALPQLGAEVIEGDVGTFLAGEGECPGTGKAEAAEKTGGMYSVPHFDAKGESNRYFSERGLPVTFLNTSFYWENFIFFGMGPKKGPDGELAITFPMADRRLPGIAAEDIGKCAYGVFKAGPMYIGRTIGIAGEHLTGAQMATAFTKALGRGVRYNDIDPDVYRSFGFPGAEDLGNMIQVKRDFEGAYVGNRDLALSRTLNPELQTFEVWLSRNKNRIPIE